jgi:hypothetical protein
MATHAFNQSFVAKRALRLPSVTMQLKTRNDRLVKKTFRDRTRIQNLIFNIIIRHRKTLEENNKYQPQPTSLVFFMRNVIIDNDSLTNPKANINVIIAILILTINGCRLIEMFGLM